ncbi:NASP-related protein sim3 [Trametes pubescens]|uniref:NASP-related protein sim3 n=1 Tax=Trametes pubescens TaxID=154538 RepID=A0A1M2VES4_TRAPU|nr:NASP-related protein sim3 [Trametes pubescens]
MSLEDTVEHAKRAFALKKYEQSVEHYASALEIATKKFDEKAPEIADLYFAYGKALLENAIAQSGVLGKQDPEDGLEDSSDAANSGAFLSFSGDAEEEHLGEDVAVDLFADAQKAAAEMDAAEEEEEEEDDDDVEPEDDFNAAWEVLDLARAIYEKHQEDADEVKLKLADTFITLGDVSLETEKFEQAISDYTAGLALKTDLLPLSSRQIAEAHYKLSIVLDLTSGRLGDSITHAERALDSVEARLAELRDALSGQGLVKPEVKEDPKGKGKGKATGSLSLADDAIEKMTKGQMEAEEKELQGLREDLALKVDELKTSPNEPEESAPALVAKELDAELNAESAPAAPAAKTEVHDLTGLVKKKKKNPEANGSASNSAAKRKAEEDAEETQSEKKAKLDEAAS